MSSPSIAVFARPIRVLRPIPAVACPRDVELVPAVKCPGCDEFEQGKRPHKNFWPRCGYPGGGIGYAEFRAKMEGLRT